MDGSTAKVAYGDSSEVPRCAHIEACGWVEHYGLFACLMEMTREMWRWLWYVLYVYEALWFSGFGFRMEEWKNGCMNVFPLR